MTQKLYDIPVQGPIFNIEDDLKLREELISIHGISPFIPEDSSARGYMVGAHMPQAVVVLGGQEKLIQTGYETQLGDNTFSVRIPEDKDAKVLKIITRYNSMEAGGIAAIPEIILIVELFSDNPTVEPIIDMMVIPYKHTLGGQTNFGFKYIRSPILDEIVPGSTIPRGTVLADSPAVTKNKGYKFGINANVALLTLPETAEDGVVISKSAAKKLSYNTYTTRVVEFGAQSFPLNIYGDSENYKGFPDIGEAVSEEGVLIALRDYAPELAAALCSINDVQDYNPVYDKCMYVNGRNNNTQDAPDNGKVVDIKIFHNPIFKKYMYSNIVQPDKYVKGFKKYYRDILDTYKELESNHYMLYRNNNMQISEQFHRLVVEAQAILNENSDTTFSYRHESLDLYRAEFVVEYLVTPGISAKVSDLHGSKGVITAVWDDEDMPLDQNGVRADIVMDPSSVVSRMNAGRVYEQYFNGASRQAQLMVREALGVSKVYDRVTMGDINIDSYSHTEINMAMDILLGLLKIIDTEQYTSYLNLDIEQQKVIVYEVLTEEFYLLYRVSSKRAPYEITSAIVNSPYAPLISNVELTVNGKKKMSHSPVFIGPLYTILLSKTADNFLSTSSSKTNHYGLPIGVSNSNKHRFPYRNSPVKILSETEVRLIAAYGGRYPLAEIKDRANSIKSQDAIYRNILEATQPTNMYSVIDRKVNPYGDDIAMRLVDNIFNVGGLSINYVKDK